MKTGGYLKSHSSLRKFREVRGEEENVWQVNEADRKFSIEIRKRDGGQCMNCGSPMFLGCSHYFGRGIWSTRFNPLNCIALCQECHELWEHEKNGVYRDFMIMWLGEEEFNLLKYRAEEVKITPYEAITKLMELCRNLPDNDIQY